MNIYMFQDLVALAFSVIKIKFGLSFLLVLFHFMAFCLNIKTNLHLVFLNPSCPTLCICQCFKDYLWEL